MFLDLIGIRLFDHTQLNDDGFALLQLSITEIQNEGFVRCTVANGPSDFKRAINHIYFFRSQDAMPNTRQI